jgi:uncharacterized protein YdgA (DUF945 family)
MAKVSKVIIATLAGSAALWLGGTAYISSATQSELNHYVTKVNSLYQANGVKMSVEAFDKGFFTSRAKMKIDFTQTPLREALAQTLKLPMVVEYEIENGPLFFKEGLGVGASRITTHLNLEDYMVDKEAFHQLVKEGVEVTYQSSIDFAKNASFVAKTNKVVLNVEGDEVDISPVDIEGEMNIETFQGHMKMLTDAITTQSAQGIFNAKDIKLDADIKKFYENGFYLGDFVLSLGSVDMKGTQLPFELKEAKVVMRMNIEENDDKTIDMKFKIDADVGNSKLPMEYASLKKAEFSYALNGAKLEGLLALQDYVKKLQAKQQDIMQRIISPTTGEVDMDVYAELEQLEKRMDEEMTVLVAKLLKKDKTNLDLKIDMTDKKANKSDLKLNVTYVGDENLPTSAKALKEKFAKELLHLLAIDFHVELEKAYIQNLPPQFQQELAAQLQMGAMFGVVQENNDSYTLELRYKNDQLIINGQDRSEMMKMIPQGIF